MRSMKVLPGWAVMRTLIQSDSTVVPPVTAQRSPPASRITGADSPVIALSLTEATPSMMSPSDGMICPASTRTTSPARRSSAGTFSMTALRCAEPSGSSSRLAMVSDRVARSVAACALPRPSATASAKVANSTVNQSHKAIWPEKDGWPVSRNIERSHSRVTSAATTSVTKITGLAASLCGASFLTASTAAARMIAVSNSDSLCLERDFCDISIHLKRSCRQASGHARQSDQGRGRGRIAGRRQSG